MGSLNVLAEALADIKEHITTILTSASYQSSVLDAISSKTGGGTVTVDFTSVIAAINTSNADLNAVASAIGQTNTKLDSTIAGLNSVVSAIQALLPITRCTTATKFTANLSGAVGGLLIPANPNRKGFTIYNNSTNSLYVCIENPPVAANLIDFCATNAGPTSVVKWFGPGVPTQAIYGIRNTGSGGVTAWEFT